MFSKCNLQLLKYTLIPGLMGVVLLYLTLLVQPLNDK